MCAVASVMRTYAHLNFCQMAISYVYHNAFRVICFVTKFEYIARPPIRTTIFFYWRYRTEFSFIYIQYTAVYLACKFIIFIYSILYENKSAVGHSEWGVNFDNKAQRYFWLCCSILYVRLIQNKQSDIWFAISWYKRENYRVYHIENNLHLAWQSFKFT